MLRVALIIYLISCISLYHNGFFSGVVAFICIILGGIITFFADKHLNRESKERRDKLVEDLASYAHEAWSGWMVYLFDLSQIDENNNTIIPKEMTERWQYQMKTIYGDLPEEMKESDRIEARKIIKVFEDAE